MRTIIAAVSLLLCCMANAAQLQIQLNNAPPQGYIVFQVYDSAAAFGDTRGPASEVRLPANGIGPYVIQDLDAGRFAILAYHDRNNNQVLDRNFIGIPKEWIAMSNNYRPKGPPSFERASFNLEKDEVRALSMELFQILGQRGQWGIGPGAIAQSSPYVDSNNSVFQAIPAITYAGERLQWFGPRLQYGVAGSGNVRVALTAQYRVGRYEDEDSDILNGLGDRKGTLMGGLSVQFDLPRGLQMRAGYRHDALDRIGGGAASVSLSRAFQHRSIRLSPELSLNWLSSDLSAHDFGIPIENATSERPAYSPGSTFSVGMGLGAFVELSENWRLVLNIAAQTLDGSVRDSPIVDKDFVIGGFGALNYVF